MNEPPNTPIDTDTDDLHPPVVSLIIILSILALIGMIFWSSCVAPYQRAVERSAQQTKRDAADDRRLRAELAKLATTPCETRLMLVNLRRFGGWRVELPGTDRSVRVGDKLPRAVLRQAELWATGTPRYPDVPHISLTEALTRAGLCN